MLWSPGSNDPCRSLRPAEPQQRWNGITESRGASISQSGALRVADLYKDLRKILLEHGCAFARQASGSHEQWWSPITKLHVTVAVTVKSRHTANAVLKQAGIGKRF